MAGVLNTGTFDNSNHTGAPYSYSIPSYSYCAESATVAATFPNPTEVESQIDASTIAANNNTHVFGFKANTVYVINEGASDLAISFSVLWGRSGDTKDSVIVKAGTTVQLREVKANGVKVRHRVGGPVAYIISAW